MNLFKEQPQDNEMVKDLPGQLKVEYEKHKDCMEKYLNSVRKLKIVIFDKIQSVDATIKSFETEISYF